MKTCFSTLCCLNATLQEVLQFAKENSFDAVEIRVGADGKTLGGLTIKDAEKIKIAFFGAGLSIPDVAISCSVTGRDKNQIEIAKYGIDFAECIGAKGVRIFVGEHPKRFSEKVNNDIEGIKETLTLLADYAIEKGVELWLETHSSFSTGKSMKELTDLINRPNVKIIWDLLHSVEYHETPKETVRQLGKKIVHIHLKDGKPNTDPDIIEYIHTDLSDGTIPLADMFCELEKIGYDGYYSLEWEGEWRENIRNLYPDKNDLFKKYNEFIGK